MGLCWPRPVGIVDPMKGSNGAGQEGTGLDTESLSLSRLAGVSKRIRILSSEVVKQGDPGAASSGGNMVTRGKLGSLSWNKLIKNQLVGPRPMNVSANALPRRLRWNATTAG